MARKKAKEKFVNAMKERRAKKIKQMARDFYAELLALNNIEDNEIELGTDIFFDEGSELYTISLKTDRNLADLEMPNYYVIDDGDIYGENSFTNRLRSKIRFEVSPLNLSNTQTNSQQQVKDVSQSTDIYEIVEVIQQLNPDVEIRVADIADDPLATERFFSSVPMDQLILPEGFEANEKNGITNKHKTKSGNYISLKVEDIKYAVENTFKPKQVQRTSSTSSSTSQTTSTAAQTQQQTSTATQVDKKIKTDELSKMSEEELEIIKSALTDNLDKLKKENKQGTPEYKKGELILKCVEKELEAKKAQQQTNTAAQAQQQTNTATQTQQTNTATQTQQTNTAAQTQQTNTAAQTQQQTNTAAQTQQTNTATQTQQQTNTATQTQQNTEYETFIVQYKQYLDNIKSKTEFICALEGKISLLEHNIYSSGAFNDKDQIENLSNLNNELEKENKNLLTLKMGLSNLEFKAFMEKGYSLVSDQRIIEYKQQINNEINDKKALLIGNNESEIKEKYVQKNEMIAKAIDAFDNAKEDEKEHIRNYIKAVHNSKCRYATTLIGYVDKDGKSYDAVKMLADNKVSNIDHVFGPVIKTANNTTLNDGSPKPEPSKPEPTKYTIKKWDLNLKDENKTFAQGTEMGIQINVSKIEEIKTGFRIMFAQSIIKKLEKIKLKISKIQLAEGNQIQIGKKIVKDSDMNLEYVKDMGNKVHIDFENENAEKAGELDFEFEEEGPTMGSR